MTEYYVRPQEILARGMDLGDREDMRWNSRSGNVSATVCSVDLEDRSNVSGPHGGLRNPIVRSCPRCTATTIMSAVAAYPRLLAHRRRLLRTRHRHHRSSKAPPIRPRRRLCIIWEYWNADLVDETKPGNGCPEFSYRAFPLAGKVLVLVFGMMVPGGLFVYFRGNARR